MRRKLIHKESGEEVELHKAFITQKERVTIVMNRSKDLQHYGLELRGTPLWIRIEDKLPKWVAVFHLAIDNCVSKLLSKFHREKKYFKPWKFTASGDFE